MGGSFISLTAGNAKEKGEGEDKVPLRSGRSREVKRVYWSQRRKKTAKEKGKERTLRIANSSRVGRSLP